MEMIASWMDRVAAACTKSGKDYLFDEKAIASIKGEVTELCTDSRFPVPGIDI